MRSAAKTNTGNRKNRMRRNGETSFQGKRRARALRLPVTCLGIAPKPLQLLQEASIHTLSELVGKTENELIALGLSAKTAAWIKLQLREKHKLQLAA